MMTFFAVVALFMGAFGFMALMLHLTQYRQRENSLCCTDALDEDLDDCDTCPRKESEECALHSEIEEARSRKKAQVQTS